jgi:Flp pilus assembly protein TadB
VVISLRLFKGTTVGIGQKSRRRKKRQRGLQKKLKRKRSARRKKQRRRWIKIEKYSMRNSLI